MENTNKQITLCSWRKIQYYKDVSFLTLIYGFQTILMQIVIGQANSKNLYGKAKAQEHSNTPELRCVSEDERMGSFSIKTGDLLKGREVQH